MTSWLTVKEWLKKASTLSFCSFYRKRREVQSRAEALCVLQIIPYSSFCLQEGGLNRLSWAKVSCCDYSTIAVLALCQSSLYVGILFCHKRSAMHWEIRP